VVMGTPAADYGKSGKGGQKEEDLYSLEQEAAGEPEAEIAALDLCGLGGSYDTENKTWLKMTLDTGAAASVFPVAYEHGEKVSTKGMMAPRFKTTTGERIGADTRRRVRGRGEWGQMLGFEGWNTEVHKPLIAASEVINGGSMVLLDATGSYAIGNKAIREKIMSYVNKLIESDYKDVVPVRQENGVFNMYVSVDSEENVAQDLCPADNEDDTIMGGPRGACAHKTGRRGRRSSCEDDCGAYARSGL